MVIDSKAPETDIVGYESEGFGPSPGFNASVLDLGFNSAKLATYHVNGRTSYRIISQEDAKVKLGEELDETGFLTTPPIERTLRVLKMFREIVDIESPKYVLPVATSAVREAANKSEFLHLAEETSRFKFRVLSEQEEALLSYFGAVLSLRIPTGVFFDLGGGTLAIVYAEEFRVKKVLCLPLGARRLTYLYGPTRGEFFVRKEYERMKEHISELLPSRKELRLSKNTKLVGVGGTARALAGYYADRSNYPFEKLHNYVMTNDEVAWTTSQFMQMNRRDMRSLRSMGQSRAETMAAGSCVIRMLMKTLGLRELVTSTHGLREGTLSLFLHDRRWFNAKSFEPATIDRQLSLHGRKPWRNAWGLYVGEIFSAGIINRYEYSLLVEAINIVKNSPRGADLRARFHELMGVDSPLSHVDQLRVAISLILSTSSSYANALVDEYSPPLRRKDRETIKRLSAAYGLLEMLEMMGARLSIMSSDKEAAASSQQRNIKMEISIHGVYAEELLARAISTVRQDFNLDIHYAVIKEPRLAPLEMRS